MAYYRTPQIAEYNREKALEYAHKWALKRNPAYFNFHTLGGDCTNFSSQVIYAGSDIMNFTPVYGWYYISSRKRTPSWTGVNFLCNFLINNKGVGPFAELVDVKDVKPGDIVQLSFNGGGNFNHSLVVLETGKPVSTDNILISTHTDDREDYSLTNYDWIDIRYIHILGIRKY
jgi:hypothetical protein